MFLIFFTLVLYLDIHSIRHLVLVKVASSARTVITPSSHSLQAFRLGLFRNLWRKITGPALCLCPFFESGYVQVQSNFNNRTPSHIESAPTIPRTILAIHGSLTILFPYIHARIRSYALSHSWSETPTRDYRRRAWEMLSSLETASSSIILFNFIGFLWSGRFVYLFFVLLHT